MTEIGTVATNADTYIYRIERGIEEALIAVYVDDIRVASGSSKLTERIRRHLSTYFEVTDLKEVISYPGIEFTRNQDKIVMRQRGYTQRFSHWV